MKPYYFSPSIMCADFLHLEEQLTALANAQFDFFHLDVMDLHFVPNITLGFDLINQLKSFGVPRDIHLMVDNIKTAVDRIETTPEDIVTFHVEAPVNIDETITYIANKCRVGLTLNPDTPLSAIETYLSRIDMVMLMTVTPGFAGQPFQESVYKKAEQLHRMLKQKKRNIFVGVDGGIGFEQIEKFHKAGANTFVLGTSSLFKKDFKNGLDDFLKFRNTL